MDLELSKKNCVFIRGAARTWNYMSKHNIDTLNRYFDYPDYYVMMPDNGTVTRESLKEDFKGSNLVFVDLVSQYGILPFGKDYSADKVDRFADYSINYFRVAWYDYILGLEKRQYEINKGIRYQCVYYTRPDLYLYSEKGFKHIGVHRQDINGIVDGGSYMPEKEDYGSNDMVFLAGSRAADIFNARYFDSDFTDSLSRQAVVPDHQIISHYLMRNYITWSMEKCLSHPGGPMIRPTVLDKFYTDRLVITQHDYKTCDDLLHVWTDLSKDEQVRICEKYKISIHDYRFKR